jgi:hypothetical protein
MTGAAVIGFLSVASIPGWIGSFRRDSVLHFAARPWTTLSARSWPAYHLIGGWRYGQDDDVQEDLIARTKEYLLSRNRAYDDAPHRMIPPNIGTTELTSWAFSFGRSPKLNYG